MLALLHNHAALPYALLALLRNLAVILAIAVIAAAMIAADVVVVVVKNAAGGNSGKTKIAATTVMIAVVADVTQVVDVTQDAVAATSNLPLLN